MSTSRIAWLFGTLTLLIAIYVAGWSVVVVAFSDESAWWDLLFIVAASLGVIANVLSTIFLFRDGGHIFVATILGIDALLFAWSTWTVFDPYTFGIPWSALWTLLFSICVWGVVVMLRRPSTNLINPQREGRPR